MKWEQIAKLASELPEVTESTWFGTPSLKVRGKGFGQEFLMKVEPDV